MAAPLNVGAANDLTLTPTGVAVVGRQSNGDNGPYGIRLDGTRWSPLGIPAAGTGTYRYLAQVHWSPAGFTVAGTDTDAAGAPHPLVLTARR